MTEFVITQFCLSCFQRKRSEPCPKCTRLSPLDREAITAIRWPTASGRPKWVAVRNAPETKQPHYTICASQDRCPHKRACPSAHGSPPDAELVYWNIVAPKPCAARGLDGMIAVTRQQAATLTEAISAIFMIEPSSGFSHAVDNLMRKTSDDVPQLVPYLEVLGWDRSEGMFRPPVQDTSILVQLLLDISEGRDGVDAVKQDIKALLGETGPILGHTLMSEFYRKFKHTLVIRDVDSSQDRLRDLLWEMNDIVAVDEEKKTFAVRLLTQKKFAFQRPAAATPGPKWSFRKPPDISARYAICNRWPNCRYGDACHFAHGQAELLEWNERRAEKMRVEKEKQMRVVTHDMRLFQQVRARLSHDSKDLKSMPPTNTAITIQSVTSGHARSLLPNRLSEVPKGVSLRWTLRLSSGVSTKLIRVALLQPDQKAWRIKSVLRRLPPSDTSSSPSPSTRVAEETRTAIAALQSSNEEYTLNTQFGGGSHDLDIDIEFTATAPTTTAASLSATATESSAQWVLLHFSSFVTSYVFQIGVSDRSAAALARDNLQSHVSTLVSLLESRPSPNALLNHLSQLPSAVAGAVVKSSFKGMPALHWATQYHCSPATVKALVAAGASIEAKDLSGQTPLHIAATLGLIHHVNVLCSPLTINAPDKRGFTPTQLAGINGWWPFFSVLVKRGGKADVLDGDGVTLLHRAAVCNKKAVVDRLVRSGSVNVDVVSRTGETAAMAAHSVGVADIAADLQRMTRSPVVEGPANPVKIHAPRNLAHTTTSSNPTSHQPLAPETAPPGILTATPTLPAVMPPGIGSYAPWGSRAPPTAEMPDRSIASRSKAILWDDDDDDDDDNANGKEANPVATLLAEAYAVEEPNKLGTEQPTDTKRSQAPPREFSQAHKTHQPHPSQSIATAVISNEATISKHHEPPGFFTHDRATPISTATNAPATFSTATSTTVQATTANVAATIPSPLTSHQSPTSTHSHSTFSAPSSAPYSPRAGPFSPRTRPAGHTQTQPPNPRALPVGFPQPASQTYPSPPQHVSHALSPQQSQHQQPAFLESLWGTASLPSTAEADHLPLPAEEGTTPFGATSTLLDTQLREQSSPLDTLSHTFNSLPRPQQQPQQPQPQQHKHHSSSYDAHGMDLVGSLFQSTEPTTSAVESARPPGFGPASDEALGSLGYFSSNHDHWFEPPAVDTVFSSITNPTASERDALQAPLLRQSHERSPADPLTLSSSTMAPSSPLLASQAQPSIPPGLGSHHSEREMAASRVTATSLFESMATVTGTELLAAMQAHNIDPLATHAETQDTLLHAALKAGNVSATTALLTLGQIPIEATNAQRNTCLHEAATNSTTQEETLAAIFGRCPPNVYSLPNANGFCPLHLAVKHTNIPFISAYLARVPQHVNVLTPQGKTAAALAVEQRDQALLQILLSTHTHSVESTDQSGNTLLHLAVYAHATPEMVALLVKSGCPMHETNKLGMTARDVAIQYNRTDLTSLLEQRKAPGYGTTSPQTHVCCVCNLPQTPQRPLLACSNCRSRLYCSTQCQTKDWMEKHARECAALRLQYASTSSTAGVQ